jgi:small GTP-binding protein
MKPHGDMRVVMIGNASVGKTSILNRLREDRFDPNESSTIGANWLLFPHEFNGTPMEMQIWDTAGQEKFKALGPLYYRLAVGAVAVYDVTNRQSFEDLEEWIQSFLSVVADSVVVIIGNKADLSGIREVTSDDGIEFAKTFNFPYFETSALTGANVAEAFDAIMLAIASRKRVSPSFHKRPEEPVSHECC